MERGVKERLIGASILVVLIVWVVPELLSGPKLAAPSPVVPRLPAAASSAEPIRNVTVDLATSKAPTATDSDTAADSQPASAPASADAAPDAVASAPATAVGTTALAPSGPPPSARQLGASPLAARVETPASPPISRAGIAHGEVNRTPGWSVQLGSFASSANADNLVHQLKAQGFTVYVLSGGTGAAIRHRVRVGPLADRDAAQRAAAKLKALGHGSSLISPGA